MTNKKTRRCSNWITLQEMLDAIERMHDQDIAIMNAITKQHEDNIAIRRTIRELIAAEKRKK